MYVVYPAVHTLTNGRQNITFCFTISIWVNLISQSTGRDGKTRPLLRTAGILQNVSTCPMVFNGIVSVHIRMRRYPLQQNSLKELSELRWLPTFWFEHLSIFSSYDLSVNHFCHIGAMNFIECIIIDVLHTMIDNGSSKNVANVC